MRVVFLGTKNPVGSSSRDEGGPWTKFSRALNITWWGFTRQKRGGLSYCKLSIPYTVVSRVLRILDTSTIRRLSDIMVRVRVSARTVSANWLEQRTARDGFVRTAAATARISVLNVMHWSRLSCNMPFFDPKHIFVWIGQLANIGARIPWTSGNTSTICIISDAKATWSNPNVFDALLAKNSF